MTRNLITSASAVAAILALSACNPEPEKVGPLDNDPQREALANAPPIKELPPAIQASRTYRCRDNSLVYVDFYTNNTAHLRRERGAEPVILTAEGGTPPYAAEGYSVSANADEVSITMPDRGTQRCRA